MDGLKARKIDDKVNVIIVSDHGMAPVNVKQVTFLDDYFDLDWADKVLWTSEIVQIFPKQGRLDAIYDRIKDLKHTTCWKKDDIPARLYYNEGKRIAPIVCSTEEGWITDNHKHYDDRYKDRTDLDRLRGGHGYDNKYQTMMATFIAHGPAFKKGYTAEPFENIEVYNIMCKVLGLKPAKNDGDLDRVKGMLRK
jgi:predicted AlkP superfamily pyrophosphatase or phosphodiesterase